MLSWAVTNRSDIAAWTEIVASVAVIIATGFGVYQYRKVRKAQRQEKSAQIMRVYADSTIKHISLIQKAFSNSDDKIDTIINKISKYEPLSFTSRELDRFGVSEKDKKSYFTFIRDITLKEVPDGSPAEEEYKYIDLLPSELMQSVSEHYTLWMYILSTLNELEWVCMEVESGAADDRYIYGSLHQSFLPFVHKAAIVIHHLNDNAMPDENHYPYVTSLYRRWVRREQANHDTISRYYRSALKKIGKRKI